MIINLNYNKYATETVYYVKVVEFRHLNKCCKNNMRKSSSISKGFLFHHIYNSQHNIVGKTSSTKL